MPQTYQCLACRQIVNIEDGDELPRDDERCSHEWEHYEGDGEADEIRQNVRRFGVG